MLGLWAGDDRSHVVDATKPAQYRSRWAGKLLSLTSLVPDRHYWLDRSRSALNVGGLLAFRALHYIE